MSSFVLLGLLLAGPDLPPITEGELRADMRALSADLMEGRRTGTPGHALAARYVAAGLEAAGLRPGGDGGTFLQAVPLRESALAPGARVEIRRRGRAEAIPAAEMVVAPPFPPEEVTITAPVTFAGYGVSAPGHDDYAGIDVRGRIVAALSGPPEDLGADERAHHGSPARKAALAAARGARGLILRAVGALPGPRPGPAHPSLDRAGRHRW
jgi:hypothetical protein